MKRKPVGTTEVEARKLREHSYGDVMRDYWDAYNNPSVPKPPGIFFDDKVVVTEEMENLIKSLWTQSMKIYDSILSIEKFQNNVAFNWDRPKDCPTGPHRPPKDCTTWKKGKYDSSAFSKALFMVAKKHFNYEMTMQQMTEIHACMEIEYYSVHQECITDAEFVDVPGINDWTYVYCE